MTKSAAVSAGDTATAVQYNNLRDDAISVADGHTHDGVDSKTLAASAVATATIGDLQVTEGKLAAGAVTTAKIGDLQVTEGKLAASAVTEGKIGAGAVTTTKIDALAVVESRLASAAVTVHKLANGALAAGASGRAKMADGYFTNAVVAKFADALFAADAASRAKFADGIWTAGKLATDSVTEVKIADGAVTNDKLAASAKRMKGEIIMWSGTLGGTDSHFPIDPDTAATNTNWHICNGDTENSVVTPDLRDRFVVSTGTTYALGNTGGSATQTHGAGTLAVPEHSLFSSVEPPGSLGYYSPLHDAITGNTASADNRPPYYALIFLCYVGS